VAPGEQLMRLSQHSYSTLYSIQGPLIFVEKVIDARMGEAVRIVFPDGRVAEGEVLRIERDTVLIQVIGDSRGLDMDHTQVVFTDAIKRAPLSLAVLNRAFGGSFQPIDDLPMFVPDHWAPVSGFPLNPVARERPQEMIETGLSCIDGLNTLVKGQKLPIFSCAGLPSREIAARIVEHARAGAAEASRLAKGSIVVFVALGLAYHEYAFYRQTLERVRGDYVAFINLANDPVVERLLAPRFGLTVAEYLAFEHGRDVLVVITDMTNYCDALREVSTAREELPGRRGYPGYLYSDLASLYERAGRIKGRRGSVTLLPIVTMPEDDITHPIPDLTGYITEGQIVLSRELHQRGVFPPVDVLPSLSRLMQRGIGKGHTREDHRQVANLLYMHYASGRDLRRLEAIVGRDGMGDDDKRMLDFADAFEREIVHQGEARRSIGESLDLSRALLDRFGLLA
jgi:V/A-type H+/Na+-transporting ATPase subunit B